MPSLSPSLVILVVLRPLVGNCVCQCCQLHSHLPSTTILSPLLRYRISLMRFIAVLSSLPSLQSSSRCTHIHTYMQNKIIVYEYHLVVHTSIARTNRVSAAGYVLWRRVVKMYCIASMQKRLNVHQLVKSGYLPLIYSKLE